MRFSPVFHRLLLILVMACFVLVEARWAFAQAIASTTSARDASVYPPVPGGFYRGSHSIDRRFIGFYFHSLKLIFGFLAIIATALLLSGCAGPNTNAVGGEIRNTIEFRDPAAAR